MQESHSLTDIVVVASAATREHGYVSRSRAFGSPGMLVATCDRVKTHFELIDIDDEDESILTVTDEDKRLSKEALDWAREQFKDPKPDNEFQTKLHDILSAETSEVDPYNVGVVSCIPNLYLKHLEREKEAKYDFVPEYFGEVGEKTELHAFLISVRTHDRAYSTSYIHKFIDQDGHLLIWWANTKNPWKEGQDYRFTAEISKHSEFNGQFQTTLKFVRKVKEKKSA